MAPRKTANKRVAPERAGIYWAKAQDFFKLMREAALARNWNGVGLAAVHCAISASDALLVSKAGLRSSAEDHRDAVYLLGGHIRHPEIREQAGRLDRILAEKNLIEYADKAFSEKEAFAIQKQVERYMAWVQTLLTS